MGAASRQRVSAIRLPLSRRSRTGRVASIRRRELNATANGVSARPIFGFSVSTASGSAGREGATGLNGIGSVRSSIGTAHGRQHATSVYGMSRAHHRRGAVVLIVRGLRASFRSEGLIRRLAERRREENHCRRTMLRSQATGARVHQGLCAVARSPQMEGINRRTVATASGFAAGCASAPGHEEHRKPQAYQSRWCVAQA